MTKLTPFGLFFEEGYTYIKYGQIFPTVSLGGGGGGFPFIHEGGALVFSPTDFAEAPLPPPPPPPPAAINNERSLTISRDISIFAGGGYLSTNAVLEILRKKNRCINGVILRYLPLLQRDKAQHTVKVKKST